MRDEGHFLSLVAVSRVIFLEGRRPGSDRSCWGQVCCPGQVSSAWLHGLGLLWAAALPPLPLGDGLCPHSGFLS